MKRFEDKVVLVTGGNRGIGKAACLAFAKEGAKVGVCYHAHDGEAGQVVEAIKKEGGRGAAIKADVSDPDDVRRLIEETEKQLGPLDVLVNNAGILLEEKLVDMSVENIRKMLEIDLLGVIFCTRAALPGMLERNSGRIINIASQLGQIGGVDLAAYCAAKGGVIAFTKAMARELGNGGMKTNILINCVAPGPIETELIEDLSDEWKEDKERELPLGRFGKAGEVAPSILFLAGAGSELFTGQVISPNCGDTMVG